MFSTCCSTCIIARIKLWQHVSVSLCLVCYRRQCEKQQLKSTSWFDLAFSNDSAWVFYEWRGNLTKAVLCTVQPTASTCQSCFFAFGFMFVCMHFSQTVMYTPVQVHVCFSCVSYTHVFERTRLHMSCLVSFVVPCTWYRETYMSVHVHV